MGGKGSKDRRPQSAPDLRTKQKRRYRRGSESKSDYGSPTPKIEDMERARKEGKERWNVKPTEGGVMAIHGRVILTKQELKSLKRKQLKKYLADLGLSTMGSKSMMRKRLERSTDVQVVDSSQFQNGRSNEPDEAFDNQSESDNDEMHRRSPTRSRRRSSIHHDPLHIAARNGHVSAVRLLVAQDSTSLEAVTKQGETALCLACANAQKPVVKILLDAKAEPNNKRPDGAYPLHLACAARSEGSAKELILKGANLDAKWQGGATAMIVASANGMARTVELLIRSNAKINSRLDDGATSLYVACEKNHLTVVHKLLANGAKVNYSMKSGASPLYIASQNNHIDIVRVLISDKAAINASRSVDGATPLYIASENGHSRVVKMLLQHGAAQTPLKTYHATPLYIAAQNGHAQTCSLLVEMKGKINECRSDGVTPLIAAASNGHDITIQTLVSLRADVAAVHVDGASALYVTCENGYLHCALRLLVARAAINQRKYDRSTPLLAAAESSHGEVVEELLKNKALVNAYRDDQVNPLIAASANGQEPIVKILMEHKANLRLTTALGSTALHEACFGGHEDVVQLLVDSKAPLNIKRRDGLTPLGVATNEGHIEIAKYLIKSKASTRGDSKDWFWSGKPESKPYRKSVPARATREVVNIPVVRVAEPPLENETKSQKFDRLLEEGEDTKTIHLSEQRPAKSKSTLNVSILPTSNDNLRLADDVSENNKSDVEISVSRMLREAKPKNVETPDASVAEGGRFQPPKPSFSIGDLAGLNISASQLTAATLDTTRARPRGTSGEGTILHQNSPKNVRKDPMDNTLRHRGSEVVPENDPMARSHTIEKKYYDTFDKKYFSSKNNEVNNASKARPKPIVHNPNEMPKSEEQLTHITMSRVATADISIPKRATEPISPPLEEYPDSIPDIFSDDDEEAQVVTADELNSQKTPRAMVTAVTVEPAPAPKKQTLRKPPPPPSRKQDYFNLDDFKEVNGVLKNRYELIAEIGRGSYASVIHAFDRQAKSDVAIKISRKEFAFFAHAKEEYSMINRVQDNDPTDVIINCLESFVHKGHYCIIMKKFGRNLHELNQSEKYTGFSLDFVRPLAWQLINALKRLAEKKILHRDIKPENIILVDSKSPKIKLVDFGSAVNETEGTKRGTYVQSRYYRAPEIILGLPQACSMDMWSVGCVLFEAHTGIPLFPGKDENEMMERIVRNLGIPPNNMIRDGRFSGKYFEAVQTEDKKLAYYLINPDDPECIGKLEDFNGLLGKLYRLHNGRAGHTEDHYDEFEDLLLKMLQLDPKNRITPEEALKHPFFDQSIVLDKMPKGWSNVPFVNAFKKRAQVRMQSIGISQNNNQNSMDNSPGNPTMDTLEEPKRQEVTSSGDSLLRSPDSTSSKISPKALVAPTTQKKYVKVHVQDNDDKKYDSDNDSYNSGIVGGVNKSYDPVPQKFSTGGASLYSSGDNSPTSIGLGYNKNGFVALPKTTGVRSSAGRSMNEGHL
mmetsp:Transcript_16423/g.24744  ORF Transcript_16423/g.24744 Transcript_16423/m.24744 type:complete len:1487 (-) Transcript_16423:24-4484(-)